MDRSGGMARVGARPDPQLVDLLPVGDFQLHRLPDADLDQARLPVPGVVEARLPLLHLRGEPKLSEPARRQIEDDSQAIVLRREARGEIEDVGDVRPFEATDLRAVQEDPPAVIEAFAAEAVGFAGL